MGRQSRAATIWLGGCLAAGAVLPQPVPSAERPRLEAIRVEAAPVLDGDVQGDPAWAGVVAAEGFWQTTPDEGRPATERTTVRVVFTETTLYLGVVCYDREPEGIIVADSRRDSSLDETDSFQVVFDTYRDGRTGFVFGTNPAGIEYDGQITSEGEGGFGAAGGFNRNWDGAWEVSARIGEHGWSAELAIPFRTLRFPRGGEQSWGVNFQRNIRRRNETAYWSPLPRQYDLERLSLAGTLSGVAPPSPRTVQLTPYVLAGTSRRGGGEPDRDEREAGLDLKYGVTPSLNLDLTYNTDFAQVEADVQQINLDRFNLFFPEKRPFFLENAGLFSIGVEQELELFFSRRIGIGPGGEPIPILGGARLSGKAGRNNIGLLAMRADEVSGVAPRNDFAVARFSRDLARRSQLGGLFVGRRGNGRGAAGDDENFTFALDGRWGIGEGGLLQGFVARTETPGIERDDHAYRLAGSWSSEEWRFSGAYTEVGAGFNPEVGFLAREGYRKGDVFVLRTIRPRDLWGLQELRPHISAFSYWDFDGFQESARVHLDNHWEWQSGYEVHTGVNLTREGVREPFEIAGGVVVPAGTYDHAEAQLIFITNRGAPASFEMGAVAGGFFGGDRLALTPELRFRLRETFNAELGWSYNDIDLPGGSFETNLGRLRLSYSFSPRLFVQALMQYNDRADAWASNLRLGWLRAAGTGLFVVYDEVREIGGAGQRGPDRSLSVKFSRLFDLGGG